MFSMSFSTKGSWGCTFKSMPARTLGIRDAEEEGKVRSTLTEWTRALLKWGTIRSHTGAQQHAHGPGRGSQLNQHPALYLDVSLIY